MINKISTALLTVCISFFMMASVQAAVIYDETVSADLGNSTLTATALGTLYGADNLVIGSLDGGTINIAGTDEHDVFTFTADSIWSLDFDELVGNSVVAFLSDVNQNFITANTAHGPTADVFSNMGIGTYYMNFTPQGNIGTASYVASINVASVPEPASLMLLALGLLGMAVKRHRPEGQA